MTRGRPPDDGGPRQVTEPARGHPTNTPPAPHREATPRLLLVPDGGRLCWRCGGVLEATTDEDLIRCTALAQAVEERTAQLCAVCAAA